MNKTDVEYRFSEDGVSLCGNVFDEKKCKTLLNAAMRTRDFGEIFMTKEEFELSNLMKGTNPRPGRNLAEKLETDFIFSNTTFNNLMKQTLGPRWRIRDYKFVMAVSSRKLPNWLQRHLSNEMVANLGPYVRPEFRDISYFHGIDFHQDFIEFPDRISDFVTCYIYLDEVNENSAPLYIVQGSHKFGATEFPHDLSKFEKDCCHYSDRKGRVGKFNVLQILGNAGTLAFWHPATLHGTQPLREVIPRLSMRILVEKNALSKTDCDLDMANSTLEGPLSLKYTRSDLDNDGKSKIKGNKINKI